MDLVAVVGQAVGAFTDCRLRVERDWEATTIFNQMVKKVGRGGGQRPKECDKALQGKKECAHGLRKNKKLE